MVTASASSTSQNDQPNTGFQLSDQTIEFRLLLLRPWFIFVRRRLVAPGRPVFIAFGPCPYVHSSYLVEDVLGDRTGHGRCLDCKVLVNDVPARRITPAYRRVVSRRDGIPAGLLTGCRLSTMQVGQSPISSRTDPRRIFFRGLKLLLTFGLFVRCNWSCVALLSYRFAVGRSRIARRRCLQFPTSRIVRWVSGRLLAHLDVAPNPGESR